MRGYSEALADGAIETDEAAATITRESLRLERLVGDLLDLARLNRSEFSIYPSALDLGEVAREALHRYQTQAEAFGIALELAGERPAPAVGDHDRVLQVVSNLLENALRITPTGGTVRILTGPGALTVEDNGPGLVPDELPHAFERFFLYSRYGKERRVGTGLGLAIVKELVVGMGGSVAVTSEPDVSTRFTIRLPASASEVLPTAYASRIEV